MPSIKRELSLADKFLGEDPKDCIVDFPVNEHIRNLLKYKAKRFVFDAEAVKHYANTVRLVPEIIAQQQHLARAPFDTTWIEFDFYTYFGIVNPTAKPDDKDSIDTEIGFLMHYNDVYVISGSNEGAVLTPFVYHLHTDWEFEDQLKFAQTVGTSRGSLDTFFWGSSIVNLTEEFKCSLREHNSVSILPLRKRFRNDVDNLNYIFKETVADLRNMIAALLLMNRPALTMMGPEIPHARTFVRGKSHMLISHSVISIPLDPVPVFRQIDTQHGEGSPKRRHEVRGHWCHNAEGRSLSCLHEWVVTGDENNDRMSCANCDGKKWWRVSHERGTVPGHVDHDYLLT